MQVICRVSGDTYEGTAVGRREATDGELDQAGNWTGSSGMP